MGVIAQTQRSGWTGEFWGWRGWQSLGAAAVPTGGRFGSVEGEISRGEEAKECRPLGGDWIVSEDFVVIRSDEQEAVRRKSERRMRKFSVEKGVWPRH